LVSERIISSSFRIKIIGDTPVCSLLEGVLATVLIIKPLLLSRDYQQLYISNSSKIVSDDVLELLLMTFSVVVCGTYLGCFFLDAKVPKFQ
jgi:hypothetical protein